MSNADVGRELRSRILGLEGVTERLTGDIHEDAFYVGKRMFMHIHGSGHCDIRLPRDVQARVLAEGKALPHRWAPGAGYVTYVVKNEADLDPAMELVRLSYEYFSHPLHSAA